MTDAGHALKTGGSGMFKWFWGGVLIVLALGLLYGVYAGLRGARQWADVRIMQTESVAQPVREAIRVVLLGGATVNIDPAAVPAIRRRTSAWIAQRLAQSGELLTDELERQSSEVFEAAQRRIPAFADWYYSLRGEYMRLFKAAFGDLPGYVAGQLDARVFEPAGTAKAIDGLSEMLDQRLAEQLQSAVIDFQTKLARLVQAHRISGDEVQLDVTGVWEPGTGLTGVMASYIDLSATDLARQSAAAGTGAAAGALAAKKLGAATAAKTATALATKQGAGMAVALASKMGLKSAVKAGGALSGAGAGAATGAAICAGSVLGAPLAPGCALIGGAVTGLSAWLLVDKAVLEADEWMSREAMEKELRAALEAQRQALVAALKQRHLSALEEAFGQLGKTLGHAEKDDKDTPVKDYVPAEAVRAF